MANNPCALAFRFTDFELLDEVLQYAGLIWICEVEEVEDVVSVPEVSVDRDDAETLSSGMGVSPVVR